METIPEHPVSMCRQRAILQRAKSIEERPFDILDINMGCPSRWVVITVGLHFKNPKLTGRDRMLSRFGRFRAGTWVKVRIGFDETPWMCEIAKRRGDGGAVAITVWNAPDSSIIPAADQMLTQVKEA